MERNYTIPLRKGYINTAKHKRTKRAVKTLREFLQKHMKSDDVKLGQHLNNYMWKHGIKNPPHKVSVKAVKDEDGVIKAELEGHEYIEAVKPSEEEMPSGLKEQMQQAMGNAPAEKSEKKDKKSDSKDKTADSKADSKKEESSGSKPSSDKKKSSEKDSKDKQKSKKKSD